MKEFVKQLETRLGASLHTLEAESNIIHRYSKILREIRESLEKLRWHVREHPFPNKTEEVHYFKNIVPGIYGQLLYYLKAYHFELERHCTGKENLVNFIRQELQAIDLFNSRHGEFCRYYFSLGTSMDEQYFTRGNWEATFIEEVSIIMDADYCVGSYWAARLKANRELRTYFELQLKELQDSPDSKAMLKPGRKLKWEGEKTNLMELCEGLYLTKAFGDKTLKEIVEWFQENADIDLGHFYNTLQEVKRRKINRTKYMDEMKVALEKKFDEMD